jgi:hypothetical protein
LTANLIKKNCAPIGQFKAADAVRPGIRECALHVAEKFTFKNALGQSPCIHSDQLARSPQRQDMDRPGNYFLPSPMLTANQDIRV